MALTRLKVSSFFLKRKCKVMLTLSAVVVLYVHFKKYMVSWKFFCVPLHNVLLRVWPSVALPLIYSSIKRVFTQNGFTLLLNLVFIEPNSVGQDCYCRCWSCPMLLNVAWRWRIESCMRGLFFYIILCCLQILRFLFGMNTCRGAGNRFILCVMGKSRC